MYQGSTLPGIVFVDDESSSSLLFEVGVLALHLLSHHDGEIVCRVAWGVEVSCYWFLEPLVMDVTVMSIEADVEAILCFSHVLHLASLALNEVDDVPRFGGC